jgi:ribosomal protein S18 acetylase RimI-like enzyme
LLGRFAAADKTAASGDLRKALVADAAASRQGWPSTRAFAMVLFGIKTVPDHEPTWGRAMDKAAIRRACASDAAAIAAVHVAAWREAYEGLLPERVLGALSVEDRSRRWRRIMAEPDPAMESAVFVAVVSAQVAGFGSCGRQRDAALAAAGFEGEFSALYLLAAHHGQGLGRLLMGAMARDLAARGLCGAALWVLRENLRARRFYEALAGQVITERAETLGAHLPGERVEADGSTPLREVAYGWPDLRVLAR